MKREFFAVIWILFFMSSCAPSPVELTATANISLAQTQTAAPTRTPTLTPTLTLTPTSTLTMTPTPIGGGGILAFVSQQGTAGGITLYNIATGETTYPVIQFEKEIDSTFGISSVSISSDGTKLAFTQSLCPARQPGQVYLYCRRDLFTSKIDGSEVTQLTDTNVDEDWPVWSPDGTRIAYVSDKKIYVINADGSGRKRLTDGRVPELIPTWSPDGLKIAFPSQLNGNFQIYTRNTDRTGVTFQITKIKDISTFPSWSPDGLRIAFIVYSIKNETSDIYIMNADGNNPVNLTSGKYSKVSSPTWSPNGKMIAFQCDEYLCMMNNDGTGIVELKGLSSKGVLSWVTP